MAVNERELLTRFVDDLTDHAIVMFDVNGRVLSWNAGAREIFGYTSEEIAGRPFSDLHTPSDNLFGKADAALRDALQWGRHDATSRLVHKDGSSIQARIIVRPLSDSGQGLAGFGMLAYDLDDHGAGRSGRGEPAADEAAKPERGAKILVVDDNSGVLEEAVEQLTSMGYEVVGASSGAEALAALERDGDFDLLFTDVVMPGEIAGRALANKAMEICPGLKVLFASGYFEGALVSKGELETDVQFLSKPYRMRELGQKIEEVLNPTP
ncbi:MAG: PAS domain-containing hybrid sensor histidine kinase/response regulator [Reyranella sp.]|jgi:PAS domain S-box-containing protein|nr:MAG: PAS domain-containing hybrid sensor histidine kinase/response regulator [Reyranella sp.]